MPRRSGTLSGARPPSKPGAVASTRGSTRVGDEPFAPEPEPTRITQNPLRPQEPERTRITQVPLGAPGPEPARSGAPSSRATGSTRAVPRPDPPAPVAVPSSTSVRGSTDSQRIVSPEEMLADLKHFVLELGPSDKLAFLGAFASVLLSFIPWKSTAADGDILGLVSMGVLVLAASGITMAAVAVRTRKVTPQLNPVVPWLVQLGSAVLAILWCFVFISLSWDGQLVPADIGNEMVHRSQPAAGAYLAVLTSLASLIGTLMGLKEKPN